MPFGKYRGRRLEDIPPAYLLWVLDNCDAATDTLRAEIRQVLGVGAEQPEEFAVPSVDVIGTWHRKLAMRFHPDRGGTHEQMIVVNIAYEMLTGMMQEAS